MNSITREQQLIILGLILIIISGLGVMAYRRISPAEEGGILIDLPKESRIIDRPKIIIHISGAVNKEGVYNLKAGDRVIDALALAGGAKLNADLSSINLAEKIKDGVKIVIPEKIKRSNLDSQSSSGKVSINRASEKGLCKVAGIGPSTAKKIIEYRSSKGPFSKIEDIMKVKSIGKGKFGKIKDGISL
jgi:competence protein ComEA